jgi:hypothetical protein
LWLSPVDASVKRLRGSTPVNKLRRREAAGAFLHGRWRMFCLFWQQWIIIVHAADTRELCSTTFSTNRIAAAASIALPLQQHVGASLRRQWVRHRHHATLVILVVPVCVGVGGTTSGVGGQGDARWRSSGFDRRFARRRERQGGGQCDRQTQAEVMMKSQCICDAVSEESVDESATSQRNLLK